MKVSETYLSRHIGLLWTIAFAIGLGVCAAGQDLDDYNHRNGRRLTKASILRMGIHRFTDLRARGRFLEPFELYVQLAKEEKERRLMAIPGLAGSTLRKLDESLLRLEGVISSIHAQMSASPHAVRSDAYEVEAKRLDTICTAAGNCKHLTSSAQVDFTKLRAVCRLLQNKAKTYEISVGKLERDFRGHDWKPTTIRLLQDIRAKVKNTLVSCNGLSVSATIRIERLMKTYVSYLVDAAKQLDL